MNMKRVLTLTLLLSLVGATAAFGDSLWGTFEGYSKAKVVVNGEEMKFGDGDVPAFVVKGKTMLPLRQTAESLGAIVRWDSDLQTAYIDKPNVHMFVSEDVDKTFSIKRPFGRVAHNETRSFVVSIQVDSLKTKATGFKISIESPSGKEAVEPLTVPLEKSDESFWYTWPFKVHFSERGAYTVQFSLVTDGGSAVVSKKTILSE